MSAGKTYTEATIDVGLADSVWCLIDWIEHSVDPVKMIYIRATKDKKSDKYHISFGRYEPGMEDKYDDMIAAMSVEPSMDDDVKIEDPEFGKAMKFMYFYQAAYSSISKLEMGLL